MPQFIKIKEEEKREFLEKLKEKCGGTWDYVYPKLGISRTMIFHYLSGKCLIPKEVFDKMIRITENNVRFEAVEKDKFIEKEIILPTINSELCEIFGIINGDGHMNNYSYEISVVGDMKETEYCSYLKNILEENLRLKFNLTFQESMSCYKLKVYAKNMVLHLHKEYGLPLGNKIGKLKIPDVVFSNKEWLKSYLRGLYDTDGCFHIRRKKDPMIAITSADPVYLQEVRSALESLGFRISKGDQRIFIYNKKDVHRFFNEVKPANTKHLKKYQNYLNLERGSYNGSIIGFQD